MGVPKFFRSLSERYPCLSELVKEFQIPDFDNLYLDMNGIIHVCSHPSDFDLHFSITEEQIFANIFHYIEVLFNMIKPRKLFFMAVDGVAPRAKMNQQRARRFRTAKEAELREKEALEKGDNPLTKERFDSNCITPGTVFMKRLHNQLKYFISSKISTDPLWQHCKIILSGHQTPGEGEHKIMDHIRHLKMQPDYDKNTKHCLYGLDADLIILGMCTHEPHFCILREKVEFKKKNRSKQILSPDETDFYLLHLSLLREYLDLEFQELKETLPFQYNLENIVDDWILMSFLVGNDFIPNLPDLHIHKGAFKILYETYKQVLPTVDGYLNESGYLNLPRFQQFMEKLGEHDLEEFEDTYANLAFFEEKTGRSWSSNDKKSNGKSGKSSELEELIKATNELLEMSEDEFLEDEADENEEGDTFSWEFCQHKKNYYTNKLDYSTVTPEVLKSQAEGYVRAIQWILHYYYHGCQSWSWYYPHHYAPYTSDIKDFKDLKLDFDLGKPFLPFEQLLAVLPAGSKDLLPEPYRHLMTSPNSPIKDFYPENLEVDLNGKQQDWEAVVLIPFIEEKRLIAAMEDIYEKLTPEEKQRNKHGPMHVYEYTEKDLGVYKSVEYFPSIPSNHALMKDVFREELAVENFNFKQNLSSKGLRDVFYLGFPTLKHIPYTACIKMAKVKVFEQPSKGENMILTLKKRESPPVEVLVKKLLGKIIYVNWPHLVESKAISVCTESGRYFLTEDGQIEREDFGKQEQMQWLGEGKDITRHYMDKLGVEIGPVEVIVHVLTLDGRKYILGPKGKVTFEKIWSTNPRPCALQTIVQEDQFQSSSIPLHIDITDAFPVNSVVFMLGRPHFGSIGRVVENEFFSKSGRLKVELKAVNDPEIDGMLLQSAEKVVYLPCRVAALRVGISPRLFARLTGSILLCRGSELDDPGSKINIGLSLKYFKKNEEIPGYTKWENGNWVYSKKAIAVVAEYVEKFQRIIEYLSVNIDSNILPVQDVFPGPEGVTEMKEIITWLKEQEYTKIDRVKCGTAYLDPQIISKIEEIVEKNPPKTFTRCMQVKPHLLYKNDLVLGNVPPIKFARHLLLDRVVSIRSSYTVPTGLRGYIIGIHPAPLDSDYMYDVLFDKPFVGGLKAKSSSEKTFRMSKPSFLNISDANRQCQRSTVPPFGFAPTNDVQLRPSYQEPNASAFAQFSQHPPRSVVRGCSDDEFKKMWSNLQAPKPQEDALKKILKIEKEEKRNIEDSVKSFFEKVTKAAIEPPKAPRDPENTHQPRNKYYLQLFSYYQKRCMGQPMFKFIYIGKRVTAQVFFKDGKVYSGLPCDDKESACESASLQALGALGEIPLNNNASLQKEREKERKILESQQKLTNAMKPRGEQQKRPPQTSQPFNTQMLPSLPDPPSQWVGSMKNSRSQGFPIPPPSGNDHPKSKKDIFERVHNSPRKKQNASALEFVPLQAITGKRNYGKIATIQTPKQTAEVQKKTEVVATLINNTGTSPSTVKSKRRPKIAAKLNLDPNLY